MGEQVSSKQLNGGLGHRNLEFACPACKGSVDEVNEGAEAFRCHTCRRDYPIISGIPDFRLKPDPFISIENDRNKGLRVLERCGESSFADALDVYYAMTPELPQTLVGSYKAHQLAGERIGELTFRELLRLGVELTQESPLLDLGCGTGGLLAAASRGSMPAVGVPVVGVDVAFRWLLIARLRLRKAGFDALFVCANAEHLPFSPRTFGTVVASDLIDVSRVGGFVVTGKLRKVGFNETLVSVPEGWKCAGRQWQFHDEGADFSGFERLRCAVHNSHVPTRRRFRG